LTPVDGLADSTTVSRRFRIAAVATAIALAVPLLPATGPAVADTGPSGTGAAGIGTFWRGLPVKVEPLPAAVRLPGAGPSWKVHYLTTSWNGRPTVVTGSVTLPVGRAPAGGWPVVSFGHGFGGGADACAPTLTGHSPWETTLQEALLTSGYAIVATDFEGIGTPAEYPGIQGPATAYQMIDIVRTARHLAPVSRSWASVGYSLGGYSALFTGALAASYAPGLRHVGTIALAPVTQWGLQLDSPPFADPASPLNHTIPYSARAFGVTTGADLTQRLTPTGLSLVDLAGRGCLDQMFPAVAGVTNGEFFLDVAASAAEFKDLLVPDMEVPVARYPKPVRVVHGLLDTIPIALNQLTVAQLVGAGTDATLTPVEGADHLTLLPMVAPQVVGWTGDLFADR
jgi:hypothetical protein